jgi:hypothetical protein
MFGIYNITSGEEIVKSTLFCKVRYVLYSSIKTIMYTELSISLYHTLLYLYYTSIVGTEVKRYYFGLGYLEVSLDWPRKKQKSLGTRPVSALPIHIEGEWYNSSTNFKGIVSRDECFFEDL